MIMKKVTGAASESYFFTLPLRASRTFTFLYYLREPPRDIASGRILAVHGSTGPPIHQIGGKITDACP